MRAVALAAVMLLAGCPQPGGAKPRIGPQDPAAEDYVLPPLPKGRVILQDAYGGRQVVDVEIAHTDEARARGMMWRTELAAGKGMLFVFPHDEVQSFWMKNTLIPLDMIFISADGRIVGVVERAAPKTLTGRSVGRPSRYVLEVPGGWTSQAGVQTGSKVELELPQLDVDP